MEVSIVVVAICELTLLIYSRMLIVMAGFYDVGIVLYTMKGFNYSPQSILTLLMCIYTLMNFNLQVVVANQRFHSLGSKFSVHLMSTTFPCYI